MHFTDPYPPETRLDIPEHDLPLTGLGIYPMFECPVEVLINIADYLATGGLYESRYPYAVL